MFTSRIGLLGSALGTALFVLGATCLLAQDKEYPGKHITLEGTVVSSACYLGGGGTGDAMGGAEHCGQMCLKRGDPAGLLTSNKKFYVLVVSSLKLAPYVGHRVRVYGADHRGAIAVDKAEIEKDGKWEEINLTPNQSDS